MRRVLFLLLLLVSTSVSPASLQFDPESCQVLTYILQDVVAGRGNSTLEKQQADLKASADKTELPFWLKLTEQVYATKLSPEDFAKGFYKQCVTGTVNLGDKI